MDEIQFVREALMDDWLRWPQNLLWVIPAWCPIACLVGVLFGALMEAGDYERERE